MIKLLLAFQHEFIKNIRQKGFIFALISLPILLGASIGLGVIIGMVEDDPSAIGYITDSSLFIDSTSVAELTGPERVAIKRYISEENAVEDLRTGEIQAFFELPADYPENNEITLSFIDEPGQRAVRDFYDFLQLNLLRDYDTNIQSRLVRGSNLIIRTPDGLREFPDNNPTLGMFLPLIIGVGFVTLLLIGSGYLMGSFLEEKSSRTVEIIVTSLSPGQFVGSKLLTMIAMSITMLGAWILIGIVTFFIVNNFLELDWFKDLVINWGQVLTICLIAIPSYLFAAGLLLSIGLILGDKQEAEPVGPLLLLVAFIPLWLIAPITSDINGSLAILLSFIPMTSIMTIGIRSMFIHIPTWQVIASVSIQILFAAGAIWMSVRIFHMGLLRYGKRIRWVEIRAKFLDIVGEIQ